MTNLHSISLLTRGYFEDIADVTLPATIRANDFCIVQSGTEQATSTPSGWTHLGRELAGATGQATQDIYYRVMDGTEDGTTVTFGSGGGVQEKRALWHFRYVDTTTPIEDWEKANQVADGPAVVSTYPQSVILGLVCRRHTSGYSSFSDPSANGNRLYRRLTDATASENILLGCIGTLGYRKISSQWGIGVALLDQPNLGYDADEIAAGTGVIDWNDTDLNSGNRTHFTLSLKPATY